MIKIRLGWAEDNVLFSSHIQKMLIAPERLFKLAFIARNGIELLHYLETAPVDVLLLDIRMPKLDGIQAAGIVRDKYPEIKLIALTEFDLEENIIEMNRAGVKSFIAKSDVSELVRAIKIVNDGGVYFPDEVARIMQEYMRRSAQRPDDAPPILNDFENRLLKAICTGLSSFKIGYQFSLSPRTIEEHRTKLYLKFKVKTKEELIVKAVGLGMVKIP